ncbi:hypothetical protein QBC43DRAFT_302001 [Cladorrhinum sp. PSN259]|nr:hypothetical protein QBC43DRAFT_302001 [Cladorrhinum sp. PSN259]
MLMKSVTAAAGLLAAPAAHAFLIPPQLSESDLQIADAIEAIPAIAVTQAVELECPGCPIMVKGENGHGVQIQTHRPNHLELTFSIESRPDGDHLMVNEFELYPSADPFQGPLMAPQVFDKDETHKHHAGHDEEEHHQKKRPHHRRPEPQPQRLGFGLVTGGVGTSDANGGLELVDVYLQILEVGMYSFIDDIPGVKVKLIKEPTGKLLMTTVEKSAPQNSNGDDKAEDCTNMWCAWMAAARERMAQFRKAHGMGGCHGKMKDGMGTHPTPPPLPFDGEHPPHHHDGPHHHGHPELVQGNEPMPPRELTWGRLLKNITWHILLPVLAGVVAGVSVGLIGMAVGTVIVSLWRFFVRRKPSSSHHRHSRRHSCHKVSHREVAIVAEEKAGLMAAEETEDLPPPPAYEDADITKKPAEV